MFAQNSATAGEAGVVGQEERGVAGVFSNSLLVHHTQLPAGPQLDFAKREIHFHAQGDALDQAFGAASPAAFLSNCTTAVTPIECDGLTCAGGGWLGFGCLPALSAAGAGDQAIEMLPGRPSQVWWLGLIVKAR